MDILRVGLTIFPRVLWERVQREMQASNERYAGTSYFNEGLVHSGILKEVYNEGIGHQDVNN